MRLTPHSLILKVNREPLAELSAEIIQRDRAYWKDYTKELIGDWLAPETSIETICAFTRKVYLNKNLEGFTGDSDYVRNESVNKSFAKLRSAIAGVYDWRARQAETSTHDSPMHREAEFAYKQALALGPANAETAFRFVNLLLTQNRMKDALQVAELHHACDPKNSNAQRLLREVQSLRASQSANQ